MNAIYILLAIALLFTGIYVYSYYSEYLENTKQNRIRKKKGLEEEQYQAEKAKKQQIRDEKFKHLSKRSKEIQQELKKLEEMKQERLRREQTKNYGSPDK